VLAVARAQFADRGYARTTIRSVATQAGVDPALVMYFHGNKRELFLAAAAIPFDTEALVAELVAGDRATIGLRLARYLLDTLETEPARSVFLARVRGAATEPEAAALVRDRITKEVVGPLVRTLGVDRPELRAALTSSQLFGWVVTRWLVEIEVLQTLTAADAAALIGPVLQRYLVEPLPTAGAAG
jgi:AcrR family transcriptional regulator